MEYKSSLQEIEERFDNDVERFSNLETGQKTTLDATFNMELMAQGIATNYPHLRDVLDIGCGAGNYDVIIATAVLHHLRDDEDWEKAFANFYTWLKPGGSIWIFDLVHQATAELQNLIYTDKYGDYLTSLKDEAYRDHVFDYIEKEDSPRPLMYQLELLKQVGFKQVDILHKNLCFASFVGFK